MSLIIHDGEYLDCGHYVSDVFDASTRIWWHYDDTNITEISDYPEGVYTREIRKLTTKKGNLCQALRTYCLWFIPEQTS